MGNATALAFKTKESYNMKQRTTLTLLPPSADPLRNVELLPQAKKALVLRENIVASGMEISHLQEALKILS